MPQPTLASVQSQIDALSARVNLLDGQNLPSNIRSQVAQLSADIAGLRKTLGNVNMGYQQSLAAVQKDLVAFKQQVCTVLGISLPGAQQNATSGASTASQ